MHEHETGFTSADFEVLERMDAEPAFADSGEADELWSKAGTLMDRLAEELFDGRPYVRALWPDGPIDEGGRLPFLWARLKRDDASPYAMHLGIFVSPGFCNLSLDLEKDLLDAGRSGETLDQVVGFYRDDLPGLIDPSLRADVQVWTDTGNVVAAGDFAGIDFDAFMAANRDAGHPWPKIGYILDAETVRGFSEGWAQEMLARATPLVPIYDAMIASFRAR